MCLGVVLQVTDIYSWIEKNYPRFQKGNELCPVYWKVRGHPC